MIQAWRSSGNERPLVLTEQPIPTLQNDELLVAVEGAVIGTPERYPIADITPGGAGVGMVTDTGPDATEFLHKRVAFGPDIACGECDLCRRALTAACPNRRILGRSSEGALASAVVVRARWVCVLEGKLALPGPSAALLGREAAWSYGMFVRAGVGPGEPVIITGDDIVARFLVEIAVSRGTRPLVVSTRAKQNWHTWVTQRDGLVLVTDVEHAPTEVRRATAAAGLGTRPMHLFVTCADPVTRALALALLTPGSQLVLLARSALGTPVASPPLPLDAIADADASLLGIAGTHPDLLPELAALAIRGEIDISGAAEMISHNQLADARALDLSAEPDDDALPHATIAVFG